MNDVKDILNKMRFVPEELQDTVLENIKKCVEKEITKSCNPIDLVTQRLKELNFGDKNSERNSEQDRRIIRIITKCMPCDWFYMKPVYCEAVQKTKEYDTWTSKWYVNEKLDKILALEGSGSFAHTHTAIKDLRCYTSWDAEELELLFSIALSNGQVKSILTDTDVSAFYRNLLGMQKVKTDKAKEVQKILD